MSDPREQWRCLVTKHIRDYDQPASDDCWSPELERAPRERLRELQTEKLRGAYRYLWECSSFYRRKFERAGLCVDSVQSLDDLRLVPVTRPEEWLDDQRESPPWGTFSPLRQEDWLKRGWMLFMTSGTKAAQPRAFRHTAFDRDLWSWHGARALYAMGVRRGDIALNCFAYGTSVAFWGLHYALNHMGVPVISGGGATTERRELFIAQYAPTVLLATPSYALHLGREMIAAGMSPRDSSVRILVCAGEPGASVAATRQRLEELWGARVHDDFGCTEVAMSPLGYSCAYQAGRDGAASDVHLMEDQYIVEALDPVALSPVTAGERGVLTVSNLFSESQPILRYVMGDWISIDDSPCPCGRTHARAVGGLHGRYDELVKINGLKFYPAGLEDSVRCLPEVGDEYKLEIVRVRDLDRLVLTIEPSSPLAGDALTSRAAHIARSLKGTLGIEVKVELVPYGTLPRTQFKAKRLFDLRG